MSSDETRRATALNRFLRELASDLAEGQVRALEDYQARYPGFEELLATEYERLRGTAGAAPPVAEPTRGPFPPPFADGRIGHYELERELGRGGQGTVYLARDTRLQRLVAIKVLGGSAVFSRDALDRFEREAALAARLDHPAICSVFETSSVDHVPYVVMRYVRGESLAQLIGRVRSGRAPRPEVHWCLDLAEQTARALFVAHEAGIVHRDVKPANVMVATGVGAGAEARVEPVVLDFGLARDLHGDALTRTGELFGTPSYMAPEQVDTRTRTDGRTDVYSLGATLFDLLTLSPPFKAPTREGLYHKILTERPSDPRAANPDVSRDLRVVLDTALEKEPDRRYQTALDFAEDLRAVRESRPIAAKPVGPIGRWVRWARREPQTAGMTACAVATLALATGLAGFLIARRPELQAGQRELDRQQREALITEAFGGRFTSHSEEAMTAALQAEPRHGALRHALALLHHGRGEYDAALAVLDSAPSDTENPRLIARMRAAALTGLGQTEAAARIERELGAPLEPNECWWVARSLLDQGDAERQGEALELIRRAIYLAPEPREVFFSDLIRAAAEDPGSVARAAEVLERNYSHSSLAWFSIAMARYDGNFASSRSALERAVELDPDFPQALSLLAMCRLMDGEVEAALELHEHGIAHTSGGFRERSILRQVFADMLEGAGHLEQADEQFERILAEDPRHVDTLLLRAELLERSERPLEARQSFQRALDVDPDNARAAAGLER